MGIARCTLDEVIMHENARVWRALGGGHLRPVLKSDGYGWGATRLAHILADQVEGFCVVDAAEFRSLRPHTQHAITLLGFCRTHEIAELLAQGALPNVATLAELDAACCYADTHQRTVRIRVGLSPSLGWNGVATEALDGFARCAAAHPRIELELWTHLTSAQADAGELAAFDAFIDVFRAYGARIVGTDTASSSSLVRGVDSRRSALRIGIGLFGAYRRELPALRCALHLEADVVSSRKNDASLVAGYARTQLPHGAQVEILRIGYGDGLPRGLAGRSIELSAGPATIATIGMQHTVIVHDLAPAATRTLLHPASDLVRLCSDATTSPHEVVVGLGRAIATR